MHKRAVVAIGGNAITRSDQAGTISEQFDSAVQNCRSLIALFQQGYDVVLTNNGQFPPGSMGPKVQAALSYLRNGGREVLITDIKSLGCALNGETGTRIHP